MINKILVGTCHGRVYHPLSKNLVFNLRIELCCVTLDECLSCLDHMDCLHGISNNKAVEGANSRKVKSEYLLLLMCGCSILQIHWMTAMLDKGTFDAVFGETLTNSPDNLAVSNARVASFGLLGFLSR
jgi:hypothetical protein